MLQSLAALADLKAFAAAVENFKGATGCSVCVSNKPQLFDRGNGFLSTPTAAGEVDTASRERERERLAPVGSICQVKWIARLARLIYVYTVYIYVYMQHIEDGPTLQFIMTCLFPAAAL